MPSSIHRHFDWRRTLARALVAATMLGATGCFKATFISDPSVVRGEMHDEWTSFFVFGLVGTEHVDVREYCRGAVAEVRTGANAGTVVVSVVTLGIYTPRKVYVTCAARPGAPSERPASPDDSPHEEEASR